MKRFDIINYLLYISIILLIAFYFKYYHGSDLEIRPFRSEVWGTAADWAMVFITGITLLVLFRTLNFHLGFNKIEKLNRSKLLKPTISIRVNSEFCEANKNAAISISFITRNNPYLRFSFLLIDSENAALNWDGNLYWGPVKADEDIMMYTDVHLFYKNGVYEENFPKKDQALLLISYEDQIGNHYIDRFKLKNVLDYNTIAIERYPSYRIYESFFEIEKNVEKRYQHRYSIDNFMAFYNNWFKERHF